MPADASHRPPRAQVARPCFVRRVLGCLLVVALLGCRGATLPPTVAPLCTAALPPPLAHVSPDALPASTWERILLKRTGDGLGADAVDCAGEPIAVAPLPTECVEPEPPAALLAEAKVLAPEHLVVRHASGDLWFVWAAYRLLASGMREGPLALVRSHAGTLEVRAAGTLRAYAAHARLEVRAVGGEHVLLAHGEHCSGDASCVRGTRLMWLDRQRFRSRPLRASTVHRCLGPAWFPEREALERRLDARWTRTLERTLALDLDASRLRVVEQVRVLDRDGEQPALPPRLFRRAQAELTIAVSEGELRSEGQSVWPAIRAQDGATDLPATAP